MPRPCGAIARPRCEIALAHPDAGTGSARFREPLQGPLERLVFFQAYLRNWRTIGSLTPSSRHLARRMIEFMDPARAGVVAELGAGTGAITAPLLDFLRPQARLLAVEIYPPFAEFLRDRFPDPRLDVIQDSAEALPKHLDSRGLRGVDYVVCCVPFSTIPPETRQPIVEAAHRALVPGGAFVAYQYSPFYLEPLLKQYFPHMIRRLVLRNVPPAFVYRAVRLDDVNGTHAQGAPP